MNMILNMTTINASSSAPAGDNSAGRLDAARKHMSGLGKAEASGLGSRRDAGLFLCNEAYENNIDHRDAEEMYDAYQNALGAMASKKHLTSVGDNQKSRTAQISKFRAFIKLGELPGIDGRDVLARAVAISEEVFAGGTKVLSPFEALRTVCVRQLDQEDEALTNEQIAAAVSKPGSKDKDELDRLIAGYKAAYKLAELVPMEETIEVVDVYARAIQKLDGEVPAMSKAEKEMAEFMAKAETFGFQINRPALR